MAKKRTVNNKAACISRVGVSWLVADAQDRLGAMMLGDVCVALQDQEWQDLCDAQRAAILEGANHSELIRVLAGSNQGGHESRIADAWDAATTSQRMAALLFARLPVDHFDKPWLGLLQLHRTSIIHGVQRCSLLRVLRDINYDLFEHDLSHQRELVLGRTDTHATNQQEAP